MLRKIGGFLFDSAKECGVGFIIIFLLTVVFQAEFASVIKSSRALWSLATHPGETARVVKSPTDEVLLQFLQENSMQARIANKGHLVLLNHDTSPIAELFNEGYRLHLVTKIKDQPMTSEIVNQWNRDHVFSRIYLTSSGFPVLQSDYLLGEEGVSREALTGFFLVYQKSYAEFMSLQVLGRLQRFLEKLKSDDNENPRRSETTQVLAGFRSVGNLAVD